MGERGAKKGIGKSWRAKNDVEIQVGYFKNTGGGKAIREAKNTGNRKVLTSIFSGPLFQNIFLHCLLDTLTLTPYLSKSGSVHTVRSVVL